MYDGHVSAGPAQTRLAGGLRITKAEVGDFGNDAYLLEDVATGSLLLVDAAADAPVLLSLLGGRRLGAVLTTHRHADHWLALADVVAATGALTYAGEHDADAIDVPTFSKLADGDRLSVGDSELEVIELVGHTPGSVALVYRGDDERPHLFTGDCLFPGGVGNTEKDPARFTSLLHDVETKLFERLPDETWVYPGHGDDTTLGAERPHLGEWRARGW